MASHETALVREYFLSWMEQLAGDVAFTEAAFGSMRQENLHLSDVMSALETSNTATAAKESPHDLFFSLVGTTCDGDVLRVIVSLGPLASGICVHHIIRL